MSQYWTIIIIIIIIIIVIIIIITTIFRSNYLFLKWSRNNKII